MTPDELSELRALLRAAARARYSMASGCTGKTQFATFDEASRRRRHGKHWLVPYRCTFCRLWHLGPERERKQIKVIS